jgi:hypothetical protein
MAFRRSTHSIIRRLLQSCALVTAHGKAGVQFFGAQGGEKRAVFDLGITLACISVGSFKVQPRADLRLGEFGMYITVLAIICLNLAVPGTCMTEAVVNSNQEQLTMGGCLGLLGFESAKEFWEHHPLYHTWQFKGWACQFGNRAPPERGKA